MPVRSGTHSMGRNAKQPRNLRGCTGISERAAGFSMNLRELVNLVGLADGEVRIGDVAHLLDAGEGLR